MLGLVHRLIANFADIPMVLFVHEHLCAGGVAQRSDDAGLLLEADGAGALLRAGLGAGGFLGGRPLTELVACGRKRLNLHRAAARADALAGAVRRAGSRGDSLPIAEAVGADGVGHIVEGVGPPAIALVGCHGIEGLLGGLLVSRLE